MARSHSSKSKRTKWPSLQKGSTPRRINLETVRTLHRRWIAMSLLVFQCFGARWVSVTLVFTQRSLAAFPPDPGRQTGVSENGNACSRGSAARTAPDSISMFARSCCGTSCYFNEARTKPANVNCQKKRMWIRHRECKPDQGGGECASSQQHRHATSASWRWSSSRRLPET